MKILLFVGALKEKLSANSNIVYQLSNAFSQMGHTVWIVGKNENADIVKKINNRFTYYSFYHENIADKALKHLQQFVEEAHIPREKAIQRFLIHYPVSALKIKLFYLLGDDINKAFCKKKVAALYQQEKFDKIIAVQIPFWTVQLLAELKCPQKDKFVYQLDPYGLHEFIEGKSKQERIALEVKALRKANKIFTTPVLARQYSAKKEYQSLTKDMVPIEFPSVLQKQITEQNPLSFDANYINVCYCGLIQELYRNPDSLLKTMSILFDKKEKIRLYFVGDIQSENLMQYKKRYPDNIFTHEKVEIDVAFSIMHDADCLLNISNQVSNQVPSKIFDYFSTGKPILNVQLIEDCPALPYLQKYPLSYTLKNNTENDMETLLAFLKGAKNQTIPFERVAQIFEENTLEFVAEKMLSVMEHSESQ
ncbi:MAG: hypothetical protein RSC00_04530 [Ruthenibacterium sp.]